MLRKIFKVFLVFILGISGGIFADQILWPYFIERPLFYQYRLNQPPVYVTERNEIRIEENTALQDAVEKVKNSVIRIQTKTKNGKALDGSGLVVTSDGLIVTFSDLIPQGGTFSFFANNKLSSYQVLKRDPKENLALVKLEEKNLPTVAFADLDKLRLGERVFLVAAVKSPSEGWLVNEGVIKTFDKDFIQTNIFEKNLAKSSPLFNIKGEALGLDTVDSSGQVQTLPIKKIRDFIGF